MNVIRNIVTSPVVINAATAMVEFANKARKAIRAGVDSWNTDPNAPREMSEKNKLGVKLCQLLAEDAIRGTLTQRVAQQLIHADDYVSERRVIRTWSYVVEADAVEQLTSAQLRDIENVLSHCDGDDKCIAVRFDLTALADQKDGMKIEEAVAFGQSAAEEIVLKRFRAMQAQARN